MLLSAAVLLLILFPVVLSLLLSLTAVQNRVVDHAARLASKHIGSEVSIGHITVTMRGAVEVSDLLVRDFGGDTLLYAGAFESSLLGFTRSERRVTLGQSRLRRVNFNLVERPNGMMNVQEVVAKLNNPNRVQSPMQIVISGVVVEDMEFRFMRCGDGTTPEYGVDMRNIVVRDMEAEVSDIVLEGPNVQATIEQMSGVEASGFRIADLAGQFTLGSATIGFRDMRLASQWSELQIEYLNIADRDWAGYKNFTKSTDLEFNILGGYLSSDDVAMFAPQLRNLGVTLDDIELTVAGRVDDMSVDIRNISYSDNTMLAAQVTCRNITKIDSLAAEVELSGLTTCGTDMLMLFESTGGELSPKSRSVIESVGDIVVRGDIDALEGRYSARVSSQGDIGDVGVEIEGERGESAIALGGDVTLTNLNLGRLLSSRDMGFVSMHSSFDGEILNRGGVDMNTRSEIELFEWRGDRLEGIDLRAHITPDSVDMDIRSRAEELMFAINASGRGLRDEIPHYRAEVDLRRADLNRLEINRRDSTSILSLRANVTAQGRDVELAEVMVELLDGEYRYNDKVVKSDRATIDIYSGDDRKSVVFKSDFADADLISYSSVKSIIDYMKSSFVRYVPSLYATPHNAQLRLSSILSGERGRVAESPGTDMTTLNIVAHNINPITDAISEGLQIGDGSSLALNFNISKRLFDLNLRSSYLEHNSMLAIGLDMSAKSVGDSIAVTSRCEELFLGTSYIKEGTLRAGVRNDRVDVVAGFQNPADSSLAHIALEMDVDRSPTLGVGVKARLLPSTVSRRGVKWQLRARGMEFNSYGVDVDRFSMMSDDQLMSIDGVISRSTSDTIRMKMENFDLSIFSALISQLGYNINGRTNGEIEVASAMESARLEALVLLDSVSINTIPAPAMAMSVEWDTKLNRAKMYLRNRVSRDTLIRGYYIPTQVRYYARLDVDSLNMGMLDPPLGGVITDTKGYADVGVTLQGQRRNANMEGEIRVYDLTTRVAYTNVTYSIDEARIGVSNNALSCNDAVMRDINGGTGRVGLSLDLSHLSNIGYSLRILPDNLMVLNTTEADNDIFYGNLNASGAAEITGDRSGVRMNIAARSEDNSYFFMPLSSKSNISTADFITFVKHEVVDSVDMLDSKRQLFAAKSQGERSQGSLKINMALDVKPNTELQLVIDPTVGDIIRVRGDGKLNLDIDPNAKIFDIYGDYTISEGSYLFTLQNIISKRFTIDQGSSIQWTGSPTDALLNINAVYELKTSLQPLIADESSRAVPVDCTIHLGDRLTHPSVSFAIDLPTADTEQQAAVSNLLNDQETISRQFFYLMLANSFITESASGVATNLSGGAASTGFELLTNQLSNWLSSSNYNVIIRYRPESELTSEELDFGFSKGLINNRLLVELEGNYVLDNSQAVNEDASSFMGEAYITWLIDRAGSLRLKGFTQTIDRYDENQGLQETGIGLYYREDFENFKDLRERLKARFTLSPARREARDERRALRREEEETLMKEEQEEE